MYFKNIPRIWLEHSLIKFMNLNYNFASDLILNLYAYNLTIVNISSTLHVSNIPYKVSFAYRSYQSEAFIYVQEYAIMLFSVWVEF